MNNDREIVLLRIDRKGAILLAGVLALVVCSFALAEQLTMTTSYPVPSGIYNQLITTGNSGTVPADTTLNRNAGNTLLVPATNAGGKVGIGTISPATTLDVNGMVRVGNLTTDPAGSLGAIYYNTGSGKFRGFQNGAWGDIGGSSSPRQAGIIQCGLGATCTNNWVVPAGCSSIKIELIGGGGGGGGNAAGGGQGPAFGGGGGGGSTGIVSRNVTPGSQLSFRIKGGNTGGALSYTTGLGEQGGAGGYAWFGACMASGGQGGGGASLGNGGFAGSGGTASGCDLNMQGGGGTRGDYYNPGFNGIHGTGGSSTHGGGGVGPGGIYGGGSGGPVGGTLYGNGGSGTAIIYCY